MVISSDLRKEIEADIERCKNQQVASGSERLYNELIAKYSVVDQDFRASLPKNGKIAVLGSEYDYRPEIQAIAAKLSMWLKIYKTEVSDSMNPLLERINGFIQRGEEIKAVEFHPADPNGYPFPRVAGPQFNLWMTDIHTFNCRYLKTHPLYEDIEKVYSHRYGASSTYDDMLNLLKSLAHDSEFFDNASTTSDVVALESKASNRIFVVHGHDDAAKLEVARTLEKAGFEAIILHEQASSGKTIIEKIEEYTDVAFGIVLYTGCDIGRVKEASEAENKPRARQNVVFEHGYLIGKLGRSHVCALVKGDVETPGDISGVVYTPLDSAGAWKFSLVQEMRAAGLDVDANKFV